MKFFKTLIAATLGTFLALILIFFIALITISSSAEEPEPYIQSDSVLKISLSGTLPAHINPNPLDEFLGKKTNNKASLQTLKENLTKARSHNNIKGVWLEIDFMAESWANLEEAHRIISAFRDSSDKFIYASTNDIGFNEKGYYLATAADSIFAPPETFFEFDGFFSQVTFYEGTMEKLGIEPEIIRHGKYKGAVEPFMRKEMSDENEYQMQQLLNQASSTFVGAVSERSGRSVDELNNLINDQPHLTAQFGYEQNLIDSLMYPGEVETHIKKRIGIEDDESLTTVSHGRYARVSNSTAGVASPSTSNKIAVIYANGPIMPDVDSSSPFMQQEVITNEFFTEQLDQIRDNDDVKALIVRVNSPGGSGSTSDLIWQQLREVKKDMPVIVSMGGVAASGGYYISMAADTIVAEPNTITGSIGVFATKFNMKQLFNDKLGMTFDDVKSHEHADWLTQTRELTSAEEKAFQQYVDGFYNSFITKVAESRNMDINRVDELAQGRVWVGSDALENKLVDVIGGMDKAFEIAAQKSGIDAYNVDRYPKPKTFYELVMGSAGAQARAMLGSSWLPNPLVENMPQHISFMKRRDAMTLLPYNIDIQ